MRKLTLHEAVEQALTKVKCIGDCLIYQGNPSQIRAQIKVSGELVGVCRAVYEDKVGPIPKDHTIHHTCLQGRCLNQDHMEPKLRKEHSSIHSPHKTHCKNGHAYTGVTKKGWGVCHICRAEATTKFRNKHNS